MQKELTSVMFIHDFVTLLFMTLWVSERVCGDEWQSNIVWSARWGKETRQMNSLSLWSIMELAMSECHSYSLFLSYNCECIDAHVKWYFYVTLGQLLYRNAQFLKRSPFYPSSFKSALDQNLQLTEASNRNINSGLSFNFHWKCSVRGGKNTQAGA